MKSDSSEMKTAQSLASVSPELVFINYFFLFFLSFYHIAAVDQSQVQLNLQAKTGRLSQFRANTLNQKEVEHRREVHAGVHSTVPLFQGSRFYITARSFQADKTLFQSSNSPQSIIFCFDI